MPDRISRETLEGWIADFGLECQPWTLGDEYEWGLLVSGQSFRAIVAQRRSDFNYLAMQATVAVFAEHQAAVRELDDESRATFLFDLRLALHNQSCGHTIEWDGAGEGNQPGLPVQVTVGTNLTEGTDRACRHLQGEPRDSDWSLDRRLDVPEACAQEEMAMTVASLEPQVLVSSATHAGAWVPLPGSGARR